MDREFEECFGNLLPQMIAELTSYVSVDNLRDLREINCTIVRMTRIKIDLPQKFVFATKIPVRVSDLNYGGHVGNDSMLTLMQEARTLFYRHLGFESEVKLDGTVGQIIADAAIVYKSEAFLGEILIIQIAVSDIGRVGFDLFYRVTDKVTKREVAHGKTGIVCFDYQKRKVASIPNSLLTKISESGSG